MRRITVLLVIAWLMLLTSAGAQSSKYVVEAKTVLAAEGAAPGSTLKAAVVARIAPGYHINDHKPRQEYLIPTEWKLAGTPEISVVKMAYPQGELKKFAFSDEALAVYEGDLTVGALLKVAPTTKPGAYTLKGDFRYQACNDYACLPPKSLPLTLTVNVVPRGTPAKRVNAEVFANVRFD